MRPQDQYTTPIIARITDKWFVSESTSVYLGQWVYSWHEQYFDPSTGILADNPAGRIGTYDPFTDTAVAVLTDKNNRSLPVNAYVSLNQQGLVNGQPLYQTATTSQVDMLMITGPSDAGVYPATIMGYQDGAFYELQQATFQELNGTTIDVTNSPVVTGVLLEAADPDLLSLPAYGGVVSGGGGSSEVSSGVGTLSSDYSFSLSGTDWQDTPLEVELPYAGLYQLTLSAWAQASLPSASTFAIIASVRLWDEAEGVAVANGASILLAGDYLFGSIYISTASVCFSTILDVGVTDVTAGPKTIRVQVRVSTGSPVNWITMFKGSGGASTALQWVKLRD